ncbi:N-acetylglutaminylglutamine amidotransferase [Pseudonocardia sp.]|jgi:asparagine synthase (glutamine-hydrolysing)|uniref:N-acetylglutaminylglutamine amidotransferase n=1 Tax=Pseudonocardia sp. TaxID=60912 RepID=UPI002636A143|nr:N-acetylglutaminylglutamine amidotransferase [Pseudonocardia sp.]MCW2717938.1 asparagine synthase family amidotransferase [Pseudonocardia sp.]
MCGIAGEIRFDGGTADAEAVARITAAMHRRGPDGSGVHASGPIALGHRRLKIIDLSERGAQPMVDPGLGLSAVFNGCIYNYRELRAELEGHGYRFFSDSDTEVILKSFHRWGADCVDHFLGMFAFAVAERDTGVLTLGRDRLGIKPLYLAEGPGRLRFASSLPALLVGGGVDTSIDPVALHHYMTFHSVVPAPRTILSGIRKLPPATVRTVQPDGSSEEHVYWRPQHVRKAEYAGMSAQDWREATLESLRVAVRRRMVADVPVGVLLSGGLDSSLVVALLAAEGQTGLKTFSVGFHATAGESGDEFQYSDLVAEHFSTDHQQVLVDPARMLPAVDDTIAAMAEPMVSHDCVAFHLLSEEVAKSVTVVQSGQGADEVLAGYNWYPPLAKVPRDRGVDAYAQVFTDRPHSDLAAILEPEWLLDHDPSRAFIAEHFAMPGVDETLDAALRIDSTVMLVDDPVKRVDNMTMAWGLEARVPFLDHEFVELAAACPPELKLAHGGKGVLKEAARGVVPDGIIDRPKGYFPVPAIRHLEGPFLDRVRDAVTDPTAKARGLVRRDWLDAMLADPNTKRTNLGSNALWQVALLEMWLQERGV